MLNFEIICRTCSSQGELQSLFGDDLSPAEMLTEIVDIKIIRGDKYPQNICVRCLDVLKSAYLFKNQCVEVYRKFEQYLSLSSENFIDCKEGLVNSIKEERQEDHSDTDEEWVELDDVNVTEKKLYGCEQCNVQFKNQKPYKRHLKQHEQLYMYPISGAHFSSEYNLEQQSRKNFTDTSFTCEYCNKSYKRKQQLLSHINLKHADEQLFTSNVTPEQFSSRDKHSEKGKSLCDYCGRGFRQAGKLKIHIRTHTGEKPYSCTECDKSFHCQSLLTHHTRINHTKEKPYKCDFCGKSFGLSRWLKLHLRIHTNDKPFTCDICNQKFRQIHHLTRHKYVHTGEKPFSCSVCNKQFTQNSNLRTHMRTHTGEKPYVCSICGKGFHDSSSMKNHHKKHILLNNEENKIVSNDLQNTEK